MDKAQKIFGIALAVFAGLVVLLVGGWAILGRNSNLRSPEVLADIALTGATDAERDGAVVELSSFGPKDPRIDQAKAGLRRILNESTQPTIKATAIRALGALKDWEAMPRLLKLLDDEDVTVRGRAAVAVCEMIGSEHGFKAEDPPETREIPVKSMRTLAEAAMKGKLATK